MSRPGMIVSESTRRLYWCQQMDRSITNYDAAIANLIKESSPL